MLKQVGVTVVLVSLLGGGGIRGNAAELKQKKPFALMVGDRAPELSIAKWIKGDPVKKFVKGKVYIVEFWATWCPPCIASMPHLTKLQKKYRDKGLTVIGATSVDRRGNSLVGVERLVEAKGEVLGYRVAWDKGRETSDAFMRASGQGGLPSAFLVNQDGRIAYIGHPMGLDAVLEEVISGKHDLEAAVASNSVQLMVKKAMRTRDWPGVLKFIDEMLGKDKERYAKLALHKFEILLFYMKEYDKAYAVGRELLANYLKDDAQMLNAIAWAILDNKSIEKRDPDLALEAAKRANELTNGAETLILDTLAYAYYHKGDVKKALALQKKAIEKSEAADRRQLEERLKLYEEKADEG